MSYQQPRYVTCRCEHCNGGIEFDAVSLENGETQNVVCPHCNSETEISESPTLLTIGDISIKSDRIVTPMGTARLAGAQWVFSNASVIEFVGGSVKDKGGIKPNLLRGMPAPILLLFLLFFSREHKTRTTTKFSGDAEVSFVSGVFYYKTKIPITSNADLGNIGNLVNKAKMLTMQAGSEQ